jgi:hypothetical protein
MNMASHITDERGEIVQLAEFLQQAEAPPAVRPVLRVADRDVAKIRVHKRLAHKALSETILASVAPDDPEFQTVGGEVVAALVDIDPKGAVETMLATQMVAVHNASVDSMQMARQSCEPLRGMHLEHASRLSRTFAVLVEALERVRNKGRQTVIVQHVRSGGQAIGVVNK